jgi:GTPase SAR1 family protein
MKIIGADQRFSEKRGAKILLVGPTAVGKTSLLRTLAAERTLFVDVEAGDLSVQDVPVDTLRIGDWSVARSVACRIGGPDESYPETSCYSQEHFEAAGGWLENLAKYDTIFIDSDTAISRLSFRWAEQQPEAFSERTGKKDVRSAYGLHGREMIAWHNQLQRARDKNIVFVAILEKIVDDFNKAEWQPQFEGAKTGRELPGIVDEIITMQFIDFGDGVAVRAFVCSQPNPWNFPAKDRSGRLKQLEEPNLGKLIEKLTAKEKCNGL